MGSRCHGGGGRARGNCADRDRGSDRGSGNPFDSYAHRVPRVLEERPRAGLGYRARIAMLVSNSGPDAATRAALRTLMQRLPGVSVMEGSAPVEPINSSDPPLLRSAQIVEGTTLRAIKVPGVTRQMESGF